MKLFRHLFVFLTIILCWLMLGKSVRAAHFHSAEVSYECISTGPDAGKFKFQVILYKDCSINSGVTAPDLTAVNVPTFGSIAMTLVSGYPQDATPVECGITCSDQIQDVSLEKYLFESDAIEIPGPPPASGYTFYYEPCCHIENALNIQNSVNLLKRYEITMYPYNGQNTYPCFDSSPKYAEPPASIHCSGYQIRYNPNAIDSDLDSISYRLVDIPQAISPNAQPVNYYPGYSGQQPFPGPNPATINPSTGQLSYDSDPSVAGRCIVAIEVNSWRCGQRISSTIRDMTFSFAPCTEANNVPQVAPPVWTPPGAGSNFAITVQAGDPVNFTLEGIDADLINGNPQTVTLTAEGAQFSSNLTDPNSGCLNTPCATLSNTTPPASGVGGVSTTFNWQTDCDHVGIYDDCGNLTNTYNFLFKFRDDYCPRRGSNIVNVAVTVVGETIIESPQPHCVSTATNWDNTISWQTVSDNSVPLSFEEYVISHSTSPNGPFQEIGTVTDINTGFYTHISGNPTASPSTTGPDYYIIQTRSGCNDAVVLAPLDTISSIYLSLTEDGTNATLNWTPVATPPLASSNGNGQGLYQVYREYPAGTWGLLGTTFDLTYQDPIVWCNEQVNYRVELTDNLPCTSVSNVVGEVLTSSEQPAAQPLDSVIVDPITGYITVCWPPNNSPNVVEYHILLNPDEFAWVPMDTVYGYNNTCWTDSVTDASSQSLWYQVFAVNNCDVPGVPAGSIADGTDHHETIFLEADYDSCIVATTLNWTPYWYWQEGVEYYDVYVSENNGQYQKIGTTTDTTFYDDNLVETAEYCYFVRAKKNGSGNVTATSNGRCIIANVPKRPEYGYNYNSTVQPGNTGVEEYFFSDSTAGYLGFEIQRGTEPDNLNFLWFLDFDPNTRFYDYVDAGAQPQSTSYYYCVIGIDSCENYSDTLNMTRTIHLEATPNTDRTNSLEWNAFEGWNGGVAAYNIYRSYDGPFVLLNTVGPNQLTATDSIEEIIEGEGNFCYYIEAVEGSSPPVGTVNPVDFMQLSRSNEACARQHPNVFIPNAFMPEGVNHTFKPVTVYVQTDSYLFQVYNRWGQRVFESNDPELGWNGSNGGKEEPQGAYVYFVSFVSSGGQTFTKRGSVTLIR